MKTTRTCLPLLFPLLTLVACNQVPSSTPPTGPVNDTGVSQAGVEPDTPTAAPSKPVPQDLEALVATLVETGEVTSEGVGYCGVKSPSYAAYEAVVAEASDGDLRRLLSYESPIVRAYVAGHIARHDGESLSALEEGLADATPIEAQYGCMVMRTTVGSHLANELCYVRNYVAERGAEAERLLQQAANDPNSPAHRDATRCLSRSVPPPTTTPKP